jgi:hypothetical protein
MPIDVELVRSLFDYVDGFLVDRRTGKICNRVYGDWRCRVCFGGKTYFSHRLIWAWHHGDPGDREIDHINHDRGDSRIENLRIVTRQENMMNKALQKNSTSSHCGVAWDSKAQKWRAHIKLNGVAKYLGVFKDIGDAIAARREAEERFGFHENHGVKK